MLNRFSRSELLLGIDNIQKLSQTKVAVFGIGGVGSFVVEGLARGGIGKFVLIDSDDISLTNINRQIHALENTVGQKKTLIMKQRILAINPAACVQTIDELYTPQTADLFWHDDYDYVVDAIDDIKGKVDLAVQAQKRGIPIISSMGAGNKLDPSRFEVADIYETSVCPLARIMRRELKKIGIKKLKVVYSKETPKNPPYRLENEKTVGSLACVVPVMGLIMASEIIKDICDLS